MRKNQVPHRHFFNLPFPDQGGTGKEGGECAGDLSTGESSGWGHMLEGFLMGTQEEEVTLTPILLLAGHVNSGALFTSLASVSSSVRRMAITTSSWLHHRASRVECHEQ